MASFTAVTVLGSLPRASEKLLNSKEAPWFSRSSFHVFLSAKSHSVFTIGPYFNVIALLAASCSFDLHAAITARAATSLETPRIPCSMQSSYEADAASGAAIISTSG
jgi:hypothetical protein